MFQETSIIIHSSRYRADEFQRRLKQVDVADLTYEDWTQNYDQKFTKNISYMIHPFPYHIIL